jgi:diadenosine tetraphosphate (Ap4A) HIT family hydrolase
MVVRECSLCRDVEVALKGGKSSFYRLIGVNPHSIYVVGEHQYFPGYCMVIARSHEREMHHLPKEVQASIFADVMRLGVAVEKAFKPLKLNYASFGNVVEHLHWHVIPRYEWEPDPKAQPWKHEDKFKTKPTDAFLAAELIGALRGHQIDS